MVDILILFQDDAEEVATRIAWAAAERGYSVWGDPNHFASAPDEEIEAAAKGARAVAILWSRRMVDEAQRRAGAFDAIDPRRTAAAVLQPGLEPPAPWRDRPNFDLIRAEIDAAAVDGFVEQIARATGSPSGDGGDAAVERLRAAEEEAASWRAIRDLSTPEVFEAYLDRFGKKGLFASLARKRRVSLRAARIAAGEEGAVQTDSRRELMIWAGGGALAASVAFGLLALFTGGDLRTLSGSPTEDVLALQSAAEYSADLDEELVHAQETLNAMQEALEARNIAVAELEIALAAARGGDVAAAGEGERLVKLAERQTALEQELGRKEDALAAASRKLTAAEAALEEARGRAAAIKPANDGEALERELAESRKETRRANKILEAARMRIEALESERSALRAETEKSRQAELEAASGADQAAAVAGGSAAGAQDVVVASADNGASDSGASDNSASSSGASDDDAATATNADRTSAAQVAASEIAAGVLPTPTEAAGGGGGVAAAAQSDLAITLPTSVPILRPRPQQ